MMKAVCFDSKGWKEGNSWTRGRMFDDLIGKKILLGKTKAEVEEILGPPDGTGRLDFMYDDKVATNMAMVTKTKTLQKMMGPPDGKPYVLLRWEYDVSLGWHWLMGDAFMDYPFTVEFKGDVVVGAGVLVL